MAEVILDFCLNKRKSPETQIPEACIQSLLTSVRAITRGRSTLPVWIKLPKKISLVDLYKQLRPADYPGEDFWEHRAGWLSNVLVNIAPESEIRETAMNRVEERFYQWTSREPMPVRPDLEAGLEETP